MKAMITKLAWGSIEVQIGKEKQTFRDCKIGPDGARPWVWKNTGTHHKPGIQPADIEDILNEGIEVLILTRGRMRSLEICPETISLLETREITYHFEETTKAVVLFNRLAAKDLKVGGVFHTTC